MEILKEVFSNLDFHLDSPKKELRITYGSSTLCIRLTHEGKVNISTNLFLDSSER